MRLKDGLYLPEHLVVSSLHNEASRLWKTSQGRRRPPLARLFENSRDFLVTGPEFRSWSFSLGFKQPKDREFDIGDYFSLIKSGGLFAISYQTYNSVPEAHIRRFSVVLNHEQKFPLKAEIEAKTAQLAEESDRKQVYLAELDLYRLHSLLNLLHTAKSYPQSSKLPEVIIV